MRAPFSALLVGAPAAAPPKAPPAAHAAEAANRGPGSQMVRPGGGLLEVIEAMAMFLAIFFGGGSQTEVSYECPMVMQEGKSGSLGTLAAFKMFWLWKRKT